MAPITSLPTCVSCAHFADKNAELEGRISMLYQIQEAEKFMDAIIFGPTQTNTQSESLMPLFPVLLLILILLQSSSLMNPGSSSGLNLKLRSAPARNMRERHSSRTPRNRDIKLENTFNIFILHGLPPLVGESWPLLLSPLPSCGSHC